MSKHEFLTRFTLFFWIITAVFSLGSVYAEPGVEEDAAVYLDEQANLPLWIQEHPQLPETSPHIPDYDNVPWSKVVAQSFRDGNWEIYHYPNSNTYTRLTNHSASDIQPRLNRGSTRIAFASNRDGDYEIYTMNLDGTGLVQLTNNIGFNDGNPNWSPDGSLIVFETQRDGQWEVYVMNADGSNQMRLTFDADYDGMPVWSPDGSRIAFVSRRTGGYRIYTMNADGSGQTQRSDQPYSFNPTWSPNGNLIAFDADTDGDGWQDLWIMAADGTAQNMIYNPYGWVDAWPRAWSPDGNYLAFTEIRFTIQNGAVYWTSAYLSYLNMQVSGVWRMSDDFYAWNPDWQTTDAVAPQSRVNILPYFSRMAGFGVSWTGSDQQSGVAAYDVQYRIGESGAWTAWQSHTSNTSASYTPLPGNTVYFRSRAYDQVGNVEAWREVADAFTTFYSWQLLGGVMDNRGIALPAVSITINPLPMNGPVTTDNNGHYYARFVSGGTHTIDITQAGYGDFTATPLMAEETSLTYLPPANNLLLNGSFESGTIHWAVGGDIPIAPIGTTYNTGNTAVTATPSCPAPCLTPAELFWNNGAYFRPKIVADSAGQLHLLFRLIDGVYYMTRSIDGVWSSPTLIPNSVVSDLSAPFVAIDNNDTLHVLWGRREAGSNSLQIIYTQKPLDGSWSTPIVASTNPGQVFDVAVDKQGTLHLLASNPGLSYLERRADGTWRPAVQFNEGTVRADDGAALALTADGVVHVVWQERNTDFSTYHLFYRQRSPEGFWLVREELYPNLNHYGAEVKRLLADEKGSLHLLWFSPYYVVSYATRHPVTGWIGPDIGILGAGRVLDAVIDSRNTLHVFRLASNLANNNGAYYQYLNPGQTWSTAELLDNGVPITDPTITVDRFGILHLLWEDFWDGFYYYTSKTADSPSTGYLQQTVSIPADMPNPTLTFMYRTIPDRPYDDTNFVVSVTAGITTTQVYSASPATSWSLGWVDMQEWVGKTVTVRFAVQQAADDPYLQLFLDSVSLGSAYPDVWVSGAGITTAKPGDEVTYHLLYGNAGGVGAENIVISYTLPAEITFIGASAPPMTATASALVWSMGNLPATSGPFLITISGTVAANVPYFTELHNTAVIATANSELQTTNNAAVSTTFIGHLLFLPLVIRQ